MNRRHLIATAVLATGVTAPTCLSMGVAHAAPNCGGQNAAPQPVPYTCNLPGIDLTVQGVTRHFSAVVNADGTHVTVQFLMSAPLPVAVPIRIVHHEGISGAGGTENESQGTIPAGQTTATLTDSAPCRDGQLDVKAVFIANGQSQGRVGGPWIQNGTGCNAVPTTTTPQSTTTAPLPTSSAPPPTTSPTTTAPTVGSTAPTSPPQSGGGGAHPQQIPATGNDVESLLVVAGALLVGGVVTLIARKRERAS